MKIVVNSLYASVIIMHNNNKRYDDHIQYNFIKTTGNIIAYYFLHTKFRRSTALCKGSISAIALKNQNCFDIHKALSMYIDIKVTVFQVDMFYLSSIQFGLPHKPVTSFSILLILPSGQDTFTSSQLNISSLRELPNDGLCSTCILFLACFVL